MIREAAWTVEDFRRRTQALSVEPVFKVQLEECREEWKRRHSKPE
jgi:hypothetical protein